MPSGAMTSSAAMPASARFSGKAHHTVAIPALFLVDKQGVVRWAHDDPDFTVRPGTAQILAAIDAAHLGG
jgi:hypothetical protein